MKHFVEYEIEDGRSIIIEVEGLTKALIPATKLGGVVAKSEIGFSQALETIGPVSETMLERLDEIAQAPDEISIEFGLKFGLKAGAFIASGSSDANFKVSLSWKRQTQTTHMDSQLSLEDTHGPFI